MKFARWQNTFLKFLLISVAFITFLIYNFHIKNYIERVKSFNLDIPQSVDFQLKNILIDEEKLKISSKNQIFLIETHMEKERIISNPRQACSVESAGMNILETRGLNTFSS